MKTTLRINVLVGALSLALGSISAQARELPRPTNTLPVTSCLDTGGAGTLRSVVASAASGDTVDLSQLTCGSITLLTGSIDSAIADLTIVGPGAQTLTIDGDNYDRVFTHTGNGTLSISGLTIAHGHLHHVDTDVTVAGGCLYAYRNIVLDHVTVDSCTVDGSADADLVRGGGVAAIQGNLTLTSSTISHTSVANTQMIKGAGAYAFGFATITDSTISNSTGTASVSASGGGLYAAHRSLESFDTASTITRSTISDCQLTTNATTGQYAEGGGAFVFDILLVTSSVISGNSVIANTANGGGIYSYQNVELYRTTVNNNQSTGYAGGVGTRNNTGITASTISHNQSAIGGGLSSRLGIIVLSDSTVSGNMASIGCGGLYSKGNLWLQNATVAFNSSAFIGAGGICMGGSWMESDSSIVADNLNQGAPFDLSASGNAPVSSILGANNLIGAAESFFALPPDTLHSDPLLHPLADNGGPTLTHALDPLSPAIDAGNNDAAFAFDQRDEGFARVFGASADIGAFELQSSNRIFSNGFDGAP